MRIQTNFTDRTTYGKKTNGFTLIEFSIVLIIVGLVVSGILVGKDMIRAAEFRNIYGQVEQFRVAVQTFKTKYNEVPGDMPNATEFFGNDPDGCFSAPLNRAPKPETCDGNGDGFVTVVGQNREYLRFWQHLAAANLIEGAYSGALISGNAEDLPPLSTDVNFGWEAIEQSSLYDPMDDFDANAANSQKQFHVFYMRDQLDDFNGLFTPADALLFDNKYDDGSPATGRMRALGRSYSGVNCISGINFDITRITRECSFVFDGDF